MKSWGGGGKFSKGGINEDAKAQATADIGIWGEMIIIKY
jgi:hypothetical protein